MTESRIRAAGSPTHPPRDGGFTLVEVVLALTILSVGVLGLAASFGSMAGAGEDREREIRNQTIIDNALSALRGVDFVSVVAEFGSASDQAAFWCTEDGSVVFADPGDSVATGSILLFDDESTVPVSFADAAQGLDLNGNGTIESGAITDYRILPVRVTVTYPDETGIDPWVNEFFLTG